MILVTGATGFLGKRVCRLLDEKKLTYIPTSKSKGVDLRQKDDVMDLMSQVKPDFILNCAAYVGGIQFGQKHPVEIFQNNLEITLNLLSAANNFSVKRVVNPISNCAYPDTTDLFKEEAFWDGPLHDSVLVYGFVRKAFWVGSWAYAKQYDLDIINIVLSNMYGPEDHFDPERSHALGALIKKFFDAKKTGAPFVEVWGSGKPIREWLHVDDGAQAMFRSLSVERSIDPINIGTGKGVSILSAAELIKNIIGYDGEIKLDLTKIDGAKSKTVDGTKGLLHFGWKPEKEFEDGVRETIDWYIKSCNN